MHIDIQMPEHDVDTLVTVIYCGALDLERKLEKSHRVSPPSYARGSSIAFRYNSFVATLIALQPLEDLTTWTDMPVLIKSWIVYNEHSVGLFFKHALFEQVSKFVEDIQAYEAEISSKFNHKRHMILVTLVRKVIQSCMYLYAASSNCGTRQKSADRMYTKLVKEWSKRFGR